VRTVGDYVLVERVGAGAGGEVWKAEHDGRRAAIKLLAPGRPVPPPLDHPNIVRIEACDASHVRMEWVDGGSLRPRIGTLSPDDCRRFVTQLLGALAYAHGRGVVHGDLKPENILLTSDGTLKVTDFGRERPEATVEQSHYRDGTDLAGTVGYIAPEVMQGSAPDASSDLFSLGAVVFEMLTGKPASGMTPPSALKSGIGPDWDAFVGRLLAARDLRFASADDALIALKGEPPPTYWIGQTAFIVGAFLIFFVGAGIPATIGVRLLVIVPTVLMLAVFWRRMRAPGFTLIFWGGLFFALAMRGRIVPMLFGVGLAIVGAIGLAVSATRRL
jgi:serine/threonine protein kinase